MNSLIRMVYASTTSHPVSRAGAGIPRDVGRVLMQSRRNNPTQDISGVLYFDNNYFLQCLEGEQQRVDQLYRKIMRDPRHRQVSTLAVKRIDQRLFPIWSMKYVGLDQKVERILRKYGFAEFNPYRFDEHMVDEILDYLAGVDDLTSASGGQHQRHHSLAAKGLLSRLLARLRAA